MANEVCFRTLHLDKPWSLESYLSVGGYECWKKIVRGSSSAVSIIDEIKQSCLRGRGGAGFPTGIKLGFIPKDFNGQKYVVCNSDEGEPGTCKDREILLNNPHQLIEGMAIAAYVTGATIGYNYIRGEFYEPIERFEFALKEAKTAGFLGKNLFGTRHRFDLHCSIGGGAYICGEETALLNSLEGKKGLPRFKPPFPALNGLYNSPTNINNTETYASIPVILQHGGKWFKDLGTGNSGGTKLFCVSGNVKHPGIFEVGLGIPFNKLLSLAGGVLDNKRIKAVIPGGTSCKILTGEEAANLNMDYESVANAGSMLGSGAVIVIPEGACMLKILLRISTFYYEESCGQCTPCREGVGWMVRILNRITNGAGELKDLDRLFDIASNIEGNTICGLGEAAAWPVQSYIKKFRHEFEYMIEHKRSIVVA